MQFECKFRCPLYVTDVCICMSAFPYIHILDSIHMFACACVTFSGPFLIHFALYWSQTCLKFISSSLHLCLCVSASITAFLAKPSCLLASVYLPACSTVFASLIFFWTLLCLWSVSFLSICFHKFFHSVWSLPGEQLSLFCSQMQSSVHLFLFSVIQQRLNLQNRVSFKFLHTKVLRQIQGRFQQNVTGWKSKEPKACLSLNKG